jgi:NAD+ kinase
MGQTSLTRLGLVVHPRRKIDDALATLECWGDAHGVEVVQVPAAGQDRRVADAGDPETCDAIVALGGDGTALAALRTGAAVGRPVLGVACGSLGALTSTTADKLGAALDRLGDGDWRPRRLPALALDGAGDGTLTAVNDFVVVRQGAGQVSAEVHVDGELFIRFAGDGMIVATPLGSSAYTLAARGPVLAPGAGGIVFTPLSAHGGCCPPLVAAADSRITIRLEPGHGGARIEGDGQMGTRVAPQMPRTLELRLRSDHATLVALGGEESMLAGLRRRRVIIDSPRMLARSDREESAAPEAGAELPD